MPIFEFYCPDNDKIYQFLAKSRAQAEATPVCPDNPNFTMIRLVSSFSIGSAKSSAEQPSDPAAGEAAGSEVPDSPAVDARMERAFSEIERDLDSVDENDPKALARMMRKLSEASGEKLDGQMEEVVRKLEEGADPDSLEEELGDAFPESGSCGGGHCGPGPGTRRDPALYDY